MPEAKAAPSAPNQGKNKGGAYQDRDKPAQIRYSNISAAKGGWFWTGDVALVGFLFSGSLVPLFIHCRGRPGPALKPVLVPVKDRL